MAPTPSGLSRKTKKSNYLNKANTPLPAFTHQWILPFLSCNSGVGKIDGILVNANWSLLSLHRRFQIFVLFLRQLLLLVFITKTPYFAVHLWPSCRSVHSTWHMDKYMHVCMDITRNKQELIDRKVKRKRENNWKKRRNMVTRNTGSDTVKDEGREKTKENTKGRGSLCFTKAWQNITQSKICLRQDRGTWRSNDKVICNRESMELCWATLGSSLCGLASPATASDRVRHMQ